MKAISVRATVEIFERMLEDITTGLSRTEAVAAIAGYKESVAGDGVYNMVAKAGQNVLRKRHEL